MALAVYFAVKGMNAESYAAVHEDLDSIGQGSPKGRSYHCGFHMDGDIHVFDVWDSQEDFAAFGEHLMPILGKHGIDPGEPVVAEVERIDTA